MVESETRTTNRKKEKDMETLPYTQIRNYQKHKEPSRKQNEFREKNLEQIKNDFVKP